VYRVSGIQTLITSPTANSIGRAVLYLKIFFAVSLRRSARRRALIRLPRFFIALAAPARPRATGQRGIDPPRSSTDRRERQARCLTATVTG
jgi:hypothetical protein